MDGHFAAFSFVDRITSLDPGRRARGCFAVPGHVRGFPPCLVAEAVGQLAAWAAMSHIDFRGRPVAALATETVFHGEVRPGQMLELSVDIDSCDDEAVAYSGRAHVGGVLSIELNDCLGPMLRVADFDAPEALRERLDLLCTAGAHPGRFAGLDEPELVAIDGTSTAALRAQLAVPRTAAFF